MRWVAWVAAVPRRPADLRKPTDQLADNRRKHRGTLCALAFDGGSLVVKSLSHPCARLVDGNCDQSHQGPRIGLCDQRPADTLRAWRGPFEPPVRPARKTADAAGASTAAAKPYEHARVPPRETGGLHPWHAEVAVVKPHVGRHGQNPPHGRSEPQPAAYRVF